MYVSDSLFFIQHLFTDSKEDENHGSMFGMKFRDLLSAYEQGKDKVSESAEDIKKRMIEKSKTLAGE